MTPTNSASPTSAVCAEGLSHFRQDWAAIGATGLALAYSDDEPEYTLAMLKKANPDYAAGCCGFGRSAPSGWKNQTQARHCSGDGQTLWRCLAMRRKFTIPKRGSGFDEVLSLDTEDFLDSGLSQTSLIRLGFLATYPKSRVAGILGAISVERLARLRKKLAEFLKGG